MMQIVPMYQVTLDPDEPNGRTFRVSETDLKCVLSMLVMNGVQDFRVQCEASPWGSHLRTRVAISEP